MAPTPTVLTFATVISMYFATLGAILIDIFFVMVMEKIEFLCKEDLNKKLLIFFQVMTNIKSVDTKLSEQIKYLTQVSTGHPHEGSSYPSQKVLQSAWHRLEHVKTRITELDRLRQQGVSITPTQKQQLVLKQQQQQQQQQQSTPVSSSSGTPASS